MRKIGTLHSENLTEKFGRVLTANYIENQIEHEDSGEFSIWVLDDEQVARGADLLKEFSATPDAIKFSGQAEFGKKILAMENQRSKKRASKVVTMERLQYEKAIGKIPVVAAVLIAVSVVVAILSRFGANDYFLNALFIQSIDPNNPLALSTLHDVMHGQVWRLITPIFIHFGLLHIVFNCYWIYFLGEEIESRLGKMRMVVLVLGLGVLSNLGQFFWTHSPLFGGLSGVAYGLFGFVWMKAKYAPQDGWEISATTVQAMLFWLVLCMTGFIGHIANAAHVVGLLTGIAWGFFSARIRR